MSCIKGVATAQTWFDEQKSVISYYPVGFIEFTLSDRSKIPAKFCLFPCERPYHGATQRNIDKKMLDYSCTDKSTEICDKKCALQAASLSGTYASHDLFLLYIKKGS